MEHTNDVLCLDCFNIAQKIVGPLEQLTIAPWPDSYCLLCDEKVDRETGVVKHKGAIEEMRQSAEHQLRNQRRGSDHELDLLYERMDEWFHARQYSVVNEVLSIYPVIEVPTVYLLGVLTTTLWAPKEKLPNRLEFVERVKAELLRRGETNPGLLHGLVD